MGLVARLHVSLVLLFLAGFAAGCGKKEATSKPLASLSGTVTFKGKPLTGANMSFKGSDGSVGSAMVGADGSYTVNLTPGEWKIAVETESIKQMENMPDMPVAMTPDMIEKMKAKMKGGKVDPDSPDAKNMKSQFTVKYMAIPEKYKDTNTSGLSVTVQAGTQSHDVKLVE